MQYETAVNELANAFSGLTRIGKAHFLARLAHEQTIHARSRYADDPMDAQSLWQSNELVHRLCGYTMQVLSQNPIRTRPLWR